MFSDQEWQAHFQAFELSNEQLTKYCLKHHLGYDKFRSKYRRYKENLQLGEKASVAIKTKDFSKSDNGRFVPVRVGSNQDVPKIVIIRMKDLSLEVPSDMDANHLGKLIRILRDNRC